MTLLERYIAKALFSATGLVTFVLMGLQIFVLFVNQLEDLGKTNFGLLQAASYVFLQLPYQVYLFFPLASLIGALVSLGILAHNYELVVMRAAGMSILKLSFIVLKAALILIFVVTLFGETIAPTLSRWSKEKKMQALEGEQSVGTFHGLWLRNNRDFINIGSIHQDHSLNEVTQYHFNKTFHLSLVRHIKKIIYKDHQWQAYDVIETRLRDDRISTRKRSELQWKIKLAPLVLKVTTNDPDEMSLKELGRYLRLQKQNHQRTFQYELAYWQRIIQPLATIVMMLLAIPFIFGPLRSSTMGSKILIGAVIGFGFHLLNRLFGSLSQVMQWPIPLLAIGPTVICALFGYYLMRRAK